MKASGGPRRSNDRTKLVHLELRLQLHAEVGTPPQDSASLQRASLESNMLYISRAAWPDIHPMSSIALTHVILAREVLFSPEGKPKLSQYIKL